VVVVNDAAGSADGAALSAEIGEQLPAAEVIVCDDVDRLVDLIDGAASRAQVLGVAGGDGTVNRAASAALDNEVPLAVFPAGTLDHFAADLGVCDVDEVVAAIRAGEAVEVSVGSADPEGADLFFLNTFSVGLYPELVRRRERRQRWLGKWPALAVALVEVLRSAESLDLVVDGERRRLWLLFGGNGRYHPDGFAPSWRERLDDDRIDVRLVDAARPLARTRLVAAVLSGRLGRCRVYEERLTDSLSLQLPEGRRRLARDGEVHDAPAELVLRPAHRRLVVYRPAAT
jgi:undecaprenyl-diphosphatase